MQLKLNVEYRNCFCHLCQYAIICHSKNLLQKQCIYIYVVFNTFSCFTAVLQHRTLPQELPALTHTIQHRSYDELTVARSLCLHCSWRGCGRNKHRNKQWHIQQLHNQKIAQNYYRGPQLVHLTHLLVAVQKHSKSCFIVPQLQTWHNNDEYSHFLHKYLVLHTSALTSTFYSTSYFLYQTNKKSRCSTWSSIHNPTDHKPERWGLSSVPWIFYGS
jgi:hypothetical protein